MGESLWHQFMLICLLVHVCTSWDALGCCAGCTDRERRTQQFTEHTAEKAGPGCGFPEGKERSGSSIWIVS